MTVTIVKGAKIAVSLALWLQSSIVLVAVGEKQFDACRK